MSPKPKVNSLSMLKFDSENVPYYERVSKTLEFDGLEWNENRELRKVEKLSLESQGFLKAFESCLIVVREIYTSDMQKRQGFFVQKIKVAVPSDEKSYRLTYFKKVSSGKYCFVDFNQLGTCERLAVNDSRFVHKVGKARKIIEQQARELLISKNALALVQESENPESHETEYRINV
jgi:hypothetical protein